MDIPQKVTLIAFRTEPYHLRMRIEGYDLSGADFKFSVRLLPDTPGSAIVEVTNTVTIGTEGVRVVDTGTDDDSVPWTDVEILILAGAWDDAPAPEVGEDTELHHDFGWTPDPVTTGFYNPRQNYLYGPFIVKGSVND
jgi:hypothetical protein